MTLALVRDALLESVEAAGGEQRVREAIEHVCRISGVDRDLVVAAMWDLVDDGALDYGTDAVLRLQSGGAAA